jgi:ketosteroid isomerase-like protein
VSEIEAEHIAIRFVNEINRHDLAALSEMMTPDFRYIDCRGRETMGRERACAAWTAHFQAHPEYRIAIRDRMTTGQVVALFGTSTGIELSSADRTRGGSTPGAWRAVISDGRVSEWKVYGGAELGTSPGSDERSTQGS